MFKAIFHEPVVAIKWIWQTIKIARQLYAIKKGKLGA